MAENAESYNKLYNYNSTAINKARYDMMRSMNVDNTIVLVPLMFVLLIIMTWATYLNFMVNFVKSKRILWAEVQDKFKYTDYISRNQAKINLSQIADTT